MKKNAHMRQKVRDMKLLIDILEESYKATCNECMLPPDVEDVVHGIKNGIPIPKGHGRLIDYDDMKRIAVDYGEYTAATLSQLKPKTIIKADKAESEEKE